MQDQYVSGPSMCAALYLKARDMVVYLFGDLHSYRPDEHTCQVSGTPIWDYIKKLYYESDRRFSLDCFLEASHIQSEGGAEHARALAHPIYFSNLAHTIRTLRNEANPNIRVHLTDYRAMHDPTMVYESEQVPPDFESYSTLRRRDFYADFARLHLTRSYNLLELELTAPSSRMHKQFVALEDHALASVLIAKYTVIHQSYIYNKIVNLIELDDASPEYVKMTLSLIMTAIDTVHADMFTMLRMLRRFKLKANEPASRAHCHRVVCYFGVLHIQHIMNTLLSLDGLDPFSLGWTSFVQSDRGTLRCVELLVPISARWAPYNVIAERLGLLHRMDANVYDQLVNAQYACNRPEARSVQPLVANLEHESDVYVAYAYDLRDFVNMVDAFALFTKNKAARTIDVHYVCNNAHLTSVANLLEYVLDTLIEFLVYRFDLYKDMSYTFTASVYTSRAQVVARFVKYGFRRIGAGAHTHMILKREPIPRPRTFSRVVYEYEDYTEAEDMFDATLRMPENQALHVTRGYIG